MLSSVPLALSRAMRLRHAVDLGEIAPDDHLAVGLRYQGSTGPFAPLPGLKLVSSAPVLLSRAMRLRPVPFTVVKNPPMKTLPSWTATASPGHSPRCRG